MNFRLAEEENAEISGRPSVNVTGDGVSSPKKMPRQPVKKEKEINMERRRPPVYRPKSRTDSSSGIGGSQGPGRLRGDGGGASSDEDLSRLNTDLRQRLQDEASLYRKRLDTYRQAQQNQATLVSRLQAKVLQYKQRCADLEAQMDSPNPNPSLLKKNTSAAPGSALEAAQQHLKTAREENITNVDIALDRLEDERKRCEKLIQQNKILREQLEESHQTNEELTSDLQKLTNQFEELREEMLIKEDEWKDEEQAFNDYYSTEHNRLLNLWRDVVSVKRMFMDVQSTTERDLEKVKNEIHGFGKDVTHACGRLERTNDSVFSLLEKPGENLELKAQIEALNKQRQKQNEEIEMKEAKIKELLKDLQNLEERCGEAEQNVSQVVRMQDEIEILQNALRDIAHALINDAENRERSDILDPDHLHLSSSTPIQKSPKRRPISSNLGSSTGAFAESTISAVHAALHKYQSYIHELQVKLQSNREQLLLIRKQNEISDETASGLERRVKELVSDVDSVKSTCAGLQQERELLTKNLDTCKSEKSSLEKQKHEINNLYESLKSDHEKLLRGSTKLQKEIECVHDEKIYLQTEIDRLNQESSLREMNLRSEEDRCSRIREELLTTREELNRLYLSHDLLEQQKLETDTVIGTLERTKLEYELQLEKALGDKTGAHESLVKKEHHAANLEFDKKKLQETIKKLEDEKLALQNTCTDNQNDMQSLRKELLQAEQSKLDLESDKLSLGEKIKFLEIEKNKIEIELSQVVRERGDLSNQLTSLARKRDALNEELMRTKQKLEQASETNGRINRNLEELVHECEEKQVLVETGEKEIQRLQELLAATRSEKEALEGVLFDAQTNLETCDTRREQLEADQQELLVKEEALKGQVSRLTKDLERSEKRCSDIKTSLMQTAGNQEVEYQAGIANLKKQNEETTKKLNEEKETIRVSLEKRLQQSLQQLSNEKDSEIQQLLDRIEQLQNHIENVCQQHEELMLRAENDKQQALLIAHHDHQGLKDRLEAAKREIEGERETLERLKREANSKFEVDRNSINQLKDEINKQKAKLEECKTKCEEEKQKLIQKQTELQNEKDSVQLEVENCKVQLNLCEDKIDGLNNQLHETTRRLKEAENGGESLRKELTDVRRQLTDCNFEKEKYHGTNRELREFIKRAEGEKRDLARQLEESYQKLSNLEEVKNGLESEKIKLQTGLRDIEKEQIQTEHKLQSVSEELTRLQGASTQQANEEKELQARLLNEVEERERAHQETHTLKKQLSELEHGLERARQELQRTRAHSGHAEEQFHVREQDLLVHLEDARGREKRLEDQKHNLEVCLTDATQQMQELKAKLGGAENRLRGIETQLAQTENGKRDVEQKLGSVVSSLRRMAGIQVDGSVNASYRLMSPSRRWSPARSHDYEKLDNVADFDPELVRKGVRNLMQQVAQIERERDDFKNQVNTAKKQMKENSDGASKSEAKLSKVLLNMRTLQEERGVLEAKLGQKIVAFNVQSEALQKKTDEVANMRDQITRLELNAGGCKEEKALCEEKLEKYKAALMKIESEKRALQEELARVENRSAKLEVQRMSSEGDLQRLQMMLQEKDLHVQKLQEKCDQQSRTLASLEERCVSLKSTIDQLNSSLERAASSESETKVEIQSLQRSLIEATNQSQNGAEKLKLLQKSLLTSENERKVVSERLEANQGSLLELRRNNQTLQDQISRLNAELANNEVHRSGLESQLRLAQWSGAGGDGTSTGVHHDEELVRQLNGAQRERAELRGKNETLNNKIRQMELENRALERSLAKTDRARSHERPEKYELERLSVDGSSKYELEIRELRQKIIRLEHELAERTSELLRARALTGSTSEIERHRAAQLQAERLLDAREQSHRQQVSRLENQVASLREQLGQEAKRRNQYVARSTRAGREMAQLRQALGDSLRTVSQDPDLDAILLEQEARKLDNTASSTASLPPALGIQTSYDRRAMTPQPPNY